MEDRKVMLYQMRRSDNFIHGKRTVMADVAFTIDTHCDNTPAGGWLVVEYLPDGVKLKNYFHSENETKDKAKNTSEV